MQPGRQVSSASHQLFNVLKIAPSYTHAQGKITSIQKGPQQSGTQATLFCLDFAAL